MRRVLGCNVHGLRVPSHQVKLSWSSMNHGDGFILDLGLKLWVWQGEEAGKMEKIKALEVARRIRDEERGGRADVCPIGACVGGQAKHRSDGGLVESSPSKPSACVVNPSVPCPQTIARSRRNLYAR